MSIPITNGSQSCDSNLVSIEFLLDETGSMSRWKPATISGFNDFLEEQKNQDGQCQMTLTKFEGGNLSTPYENLNLGFVPKLTVGTFLPAGGTNLFDAIVSRIMARKEALKSWTIEPSMLLVAMTDGDDNISRNSITQVRSILEQAQLDGWTCVYLGANQNALNIGQSMGFQPGNIKSFAASEIRQTMQDLSVATTVYRTACATGTTTKNFF